MTEEFRHNTGQGRFEALVDGQFVGEAAYTLTGNVAEFNHTWVDATQRGTGIAGRMVQYGFDVVRAAGEWKIRPVCPFVVAWVKRHPEQQDLLV